MLLNEIIKPTTVKTLHEGGNVELPGGLTAQNIDLLIHDRKTIVPILQKLLAFINTSYAESFKEPLWAPALLQSNKFLSGSSLHLVNPGIPDDEFIKKKQKIGDIDTQIDKNKVSNVEQWLSSIQNKNIGNAKFLGFKKGNEQFITLWELSNPPLRIQIDLEFVGYEKGEPSDWARFSHSSSWNDIQEGIKGVFHKFLIQSFSSLTRQEFLLRKMAGRGKDRVEQDIPTVDNMVSFAISSKEGGGLRQKYEPVLDANGKPLFKDGLAVMIARPTEGYDQSLASIFSKLFDKKITPQNFQQFGTKIWSFVGLLDMMNQLLDADEKSRVVETFVSKLFAKGAQGLYKNDPDRDIAEKKIALEKLLTVLKVSPPADLKQQIDNYKKDYKVYEAISEIEMPDFRRKSIKHIHNPGSSTEMSDAEFLSIVSEMARNGGKLDNTSINLKVDGAGIRFGKDQSGRPFFMTSRVTRPLYQEDVGVFEEYGKSQGQLFEQLDRTKNYDKALDLIVNSDFIKILPKDTIVQAEMLFNDMAEKTNEGYKFVNVKYDPKKLGETMTLIPFIFKNYSTGQHLANSDRIKQQLLNKSNNKIKFIDNQLEHKNINVAKILSPLLEINTKALFSRSKNDAAQKTEAKSLLNKVRKNLSEYIFTNPNIKGKDQLGNIIEGLVINFPNGKMAKIVSKKPLSETSKRHKTAIVTAGSFVGHKGHQQLVDIVLEKAKELSADPYVYISSKVGPDDPIPADIKLETWQKLYPNHKGIFKLIQSPDGITTPSPVKKIEKELVLPEDSPYNKVILMVGNDRYEGFKKWMDVLDRRMKDPVALAKFGGTQDQVCFETISTNRQINEGGTGITFTEMRNILRNKNATPEKRLSVWSKGFDVAKLGTDHIKKLMKITRDFPTKEDAAGVGIVTKQNSTGDVGPGTIKKNLKAFKL